MELMTPEKYCNHVIIYAIVAMHKVEDMQIYGSYDHMNMFSIISDQRHGVILSQHFYGNWT